MATNRTKLNQISSPKSATNSTSNGIPLKKLKEGRNSTNRPTARHRNQKGTTTGSNYVRNIKLTSPLKSSSSSLSDPIVPYLWSIYHAFEKSSETPTDEFSLKLKTLLEDCIKSFTDDFMYRNDVRFLKVWILYGDAIQDFKKVFTIMEKRGIFQKKAMLYEAYAFSLIANKKFKEANEVFKLGISREAEPLDKLKEMHISFLKQLSIIAEDAISQPKVCYNGVSYKLQAARPSEPQS